MAKICDLHQAVAIQKHVAGLDVAVDGVLLLVEIPARVYYKGCKCGLQQKNGSCTRAIQSVTILQPIQSVTILQSDTREGHLPQAVQHLLRHALKSGLRELHLGQSGAVDDLGKRKPVHKVERQTQRVPGLDVTIFLFGKRRKRRRTARPSAGSSPKQSRWRRSGLRAGGTSHIDLP